MNEIAPWLAFFSANPTNVLSLKVQISLWRIFSIDRNVDNCVTHYGRVTPYVGIDLGQHWLR